VLVELYKDSPVGQLVPIHGYDPRAGRNYDHVAFVPDPLPDAVDLSPATWQHVTAAVHALGRLDQAGLQVPNPSLLRRLAIRREAQSTSALEGTHAAFSDVVEADVEDVPPASPALREVLNYVRVAEAAYEWIVYRPLSLQMLAELQERLVAGTRGESDDAGEVRQRQVLIGPEACSVQDARFVPPPPGDILVAGVREWEAWVNRTHPMPTVVKAALAHYQFETLHPFSDGNGRLGRLIVVLQLLRGGELHEALLTVSPWLEARRREYQDHLSLVSQTGDFDPWVGFFCRAIGAQADRSCRQVEELLSFQAELKNRLQAARSRGVVIPLAENLIGQPIITPTWAADRFDVTYPAANSAIKRLVEMGVLREMTGRAYGRRFVADQVLEILER
jgi:Fic family protein